MKKSKFTEEQITYALRQGEAVSSCAWVGSPSMIQPTSAAAFLEVLPTLGDRHQEVLKDLATVENASNMEISEALNWSINRATLRTNELVKEKLIEQTGERKCSITGRNVKVWRIKHRPVSTSHELPSNRCCYSCSKDAIKFYMGTAFCPDHAPVSAGLF